MSASTLGDEWDAQDILVQLTLGASSAMKILERKGIVSSLMGKK